MTDGQIESLIAGFNEGQRLAWNDPARGFRRIILIRNHYVDPDDLEPIPMRVAFLERGGYIDLHNTDPDDILVVQISKFF